MPQCRQCNADVPLGHGFCGLCGTPASIAAELATSETRNDAAAGLTPSSIPEERRFPPGTILSNRYRISARLGRGGMGEVYRATDLLLAQSVALKFLPEALTRSQPALERLRGEVRVARRISHPNVCRVHDIGEAQGQVFLTMEFVDGEDLASLLRRIGRLTHTKALEIAKRICAGLAAAHDKGVLHRDLKPANIMINARGEVVITDFGLASIATEVPRSDLQSGTPAYMAPEQLAGVEVTVRSDIYALGLLLFELLAGAPPYPATNRDQLRKLRQVQPPLLADLVPEVDPALDLLVARCLDPSPGNRPQSALAVAAALPGGDRLEAALAMGQTPSPDIVAAAEPAEVIRPRIAAVAFAGLLMLTLLAAWISGRSSVLTPFATDLDPGIMAQSARDILGRLGYPDRPVWFDCALDVDYTIADSLVRLERSAIRARVAEVPPLYFWYRASPHPMVSSNPFQPLATYGNPPLAGSGAVRLRLNTTRHLQSLTVIPPELDAVNEHAAPFDWRSLFDAAGLDPTRFEQAVAIWTPPTAFDARAAWMEKSAADPLRVEAAAWHGRAVFFQSLRKSGIAHSPDQRWGAANLTYVIGLLALISVLSWYNLRKRRGDVRGAVRFGLFLAGANFIRLVLMAPHLGSTLGLWIFVAIVGNTLWAGVTSAAGYLALEPLVRRRWPRALIAWTRLLSGKFRDRVVAQHVLLGLVTGAAVALMAKLLIVREFGVVLPGWSYLLSSNASRAVQGILSGFLAAASETPWLFCLLFVLCTILRNRWVGASITGLILAATYLSGWSPALMLVAIPLLAIGLMLFALRYGLLALVTAMFVFHLYDSFPMTLQGSAFYFGLSFAVLITVNGLGAYAYRNATAGQQVWS